MTARILTAALCLSTAIVAARPAAADIYNVDTGLSSLNVSGTVAVSASGSGTADAVVVGVPAGTANFSFTANGGPVAIAPQAAGSLTTSFSGTVNGTAAGGNMSFVAGPTISVTNNGSWLPDATNALIAAPANAGGMAAPTLDLGFNSGGLFEAIASLIVPLVADSLQPVIYAAPRGVTLGLSGSVELSGPAGNQTFDLSAITGTIGAGNVNAAVTTASGGLGGGTANISGLSGILSLALDGSLQQSGLLETLTIPFVIDLAPFQVSSGFSGSGTVGNDFTGADYSFSGTADATVDLLLSGTIVASRRLDLAQVSVSEPAGFALLGVGLVAWAGLRRRYRVS